MPAHRETRVLPYTPEQVYTVVADVERYPAFLPWCAACRITKRESERSFIAELAVGFKMVREQFTSRVTLDPSKAITIEYISGPFAYLTNEWTFAPAEGGTAVSFHLTFAFKSKLLQALIGILFEEAVHRMVSAFEDRAKSLYGSTAKRAGNT